MAREFRLRQSDLIAGIILVTAALVLLMARLNVIAITLMPGWEALRRWWPLLLIGAGLVLWLAEAGHGRGRRCADEPTHRYPSSEVTYGK